MTLHGETWKRLIDRAAFAPFGARPVYFEAQVRSRTPSTWQSLLRHALGSPTRAHRDDIEYLRAVAVLSVLGFHFGLRALPGGFVGVDIFFVISGFLITQTILQDVEAGRFGLVSFYERRVRRILPALHLVVLCTLAAGWVLLLPSDYERLGQSAASLGVFASNILFSAQMGYFEPEATYRPLLHTWSLAVEEQFYLVAPCLIGWLARRGRDRRGLAQGAALLGAAAALSLAANQLALPAHPGMAFYLAPFRAWEFLVGVVLAWLRLPARSDSVAALQRVIGYGLIGYALLGYSAGTPFPGINAIIPCAGAALVLAAGPVRRSMPALEPLSAIAVFFGRISYSLYLWHWPLYVFLVQSRTASAHIPMLQIACLFAVTTLLAWLSFRFIEQPIRQRRLLPARIPFFAAMGSVSLTVIAAGGTIALLHGVPARIDARLAQVTRFDGKVVGPDYRDGSCFLQPDQPFARYDKAACMAAPKRAANLLLWGDSIAAHYASGLQPLTDRTGLGLLQATSAACAPFFFSQQRAASHNCQDLLDWITGNVLDHPPTMVLLSANWRAYEAGLGADSFAHYLRTALDTLGRAGIPVVLFGPSIEYDEALPSILVKNGMDADFIRTGAPLNQALRHVDDLMRQVAGEFPEATYVSVVRSVCIHDRCPVLTPSGDPLQWDRIHLTPNGSRFVIAALSAQVESAIRRALRGAGSPG